MKAILKKVNGHAQDKKSFFHSFWLVILIVVILIAGGLIILSNHNNKINQDKENQNADDPYRGSDTKKMTETEVQKANGALASGVSIDDIQNDWYKFPANSIEGDGKPDNTNPYPLPYTDIKNVSFGADSNYIYFKFTYWGKQPTNLTQYNGDDLKSFCNNVAISKYIDKDGKSQVGLISTGSFYTENNYKQKSNEASMDYYAVIPALKITVFGEQTSTDKSNEAVYKINSSKGRVSGGPGYEYSLAAFPLETLGLKLGDTIEFDIAYETNSRIYHHEAVDQLLGIGQYKVGNTIQYKIGANTYTDLGVPEEMRQK